MLKKLLLMGVLATTCSAVYANVIGLAPYNAGLCREMLTHFGDKHPIVFMYIKDCPWAKKLLPIFQEVSNETPDRAFFAFEYAGGARDYKAAKTALACFGALPLYSPTVWVFDVETATNDMPGNVNGIVQVGLDGGSTKQEIIDFVAKSSGFAVQQKYTLMQ